MAKFPTYEEIAKNVAEKALDDFLYNGKSIREWMQIISSEDCISRQAVFDMVEDMTDQFGNKHRVVTEGMISLLPPATPKPKTGHWINLEKTEYKGRVLPFWSRYKCSECGNHGQNDFYYCPICGAKMESEG